MRFQNVNRFRNVSSIPIGQNLAKSRNLYGTSFHEILLITFLVLTKSEYLHLFYAAGSVMSGVILLSSCGTSDTWFRSGIPNREQPIWQEESGQEDTLTSSYQNTFLSVTH